jgi:hypothetical protein
MQTQPILTTPKPTAKARNFLLIGLLIAAVGYYILFGSVQQGMVRGFGWIFMACALLCMYGIFTLNSLAIYDDRLEMEYLFLLPKKTILRNDITQWEEKEIRGQQRRANNRTVTRISYILILHTPTEKVRFPSLNYDNYDLIKVELTAGKSKVS